MRTRRIHLVNPGPTEFATGLVLRGRAMSSPPAGVLAVAATIPRDPGGGGADG